MAIDAMDGGRPADGRSAAAQPPPHGFQGSRFGGKAQEGQIDPLANALQQPYSAFHQLWHWLKRRMGGC
ncbi:MAG TPA: hypothetical protein VIA64_07130 [Burkholderiales bacterium]